MRKNWPIILILAISLTTHFVFFGYPKETVFDEVHFGKFISGYFTHEYFFDIHPPLGKLLISGMGYLGDFKPGFSFAQIGDQFPDNTYLWLRLLPTLAGALLSLVIYLLALRLGLSRTASLTLGILLAIENAFLVQSRLILLDAFLLLFGFSALYFYFSWRNGKSKWYLLTAGALAGMSISVKWTGVSFLAIIGVLELLHLWKDRHGTATKRLHAIFLCLIVAPILIYISTFVVHLKLLSKSGPGDAFMTQAFRQTLAGSPESKDQTVKPLNELQKIVELNAQMYKSNATLTATHPYSSKWYTWPFMQRPIYYWHENTTPPTDGQIAEESRIYFLGNPAIWFLSTLAILYLILDQISTLALRKKLEFLPLFIVGGYIVNLLPFVGITRAMFLYHYMIGYIFAVLALVYLIDQIPTQKSWLKNKKTIYIVITIAGVISFLYFSPLTYGLPLTTKAYNMMTWFPTWR